VGQVWLPLERLRKMSNMPGQATLIVVDKELTDIPADTPQWIFRDQDYLLKEIKRFIRNKKASSYMMYVLLLSLALLSIFDTQVLAVFRRRKEMGTMMALGMTRMNVVGLFTLEGVMHGLLALVVGALYGIPLLIYTARNGIALLDVSRQTGMAFSPTLYPVYGFSLVVSTTIILMISVIVVSYLPVRKIANLKPTDALKGKM
jgi:ABC-type antimicrobial peptide transport system permease subunit